MIMKKYNFNRIASSQKTKIGGFLLLLLGFAGLVFSLNVMTPLVVDDLIKIQFTVQGSWMERLRQLITFYLNWGGRVWGEFFALLFLSIPKPTFNVINTLGYMGLVILIYLNIVGRMKWSIFLLVFINFSIWAFLPAFGQDILWVSGSANYLWLMLTPLLFLYFWRLYVEKEYPIFNLWWMQAIFGVLGIFSGWANENLSVTIFVVLAGYGYMYKKLYGRIPLFSITGIFSFSVGSLLLWLAPGNFARFVAEHHTTSVVHILENMIRNIFSLLYFDTTLVLVILFIILIYTFKTNSYYKKILPGLFFCGIVAGNIAFGVVGKLNSRVYFTSVVFMILVVGLLLEFYEFDYSCYKVVKIQRLIIFFLLVGTVNLYLGAKPALIQYNKQWQKNVQIVEEAKQKGEKNVTVNANTPRSKFCAAYELEDIAPRGNNTMWLNVGVAQYFGVDTIQSGMIE